MPDSNEIFYRYPEFSNSAPAQNGGRMIAKKVTSMQRNAMLPAITRENRTSGVTNYRKFFTHFTNADNEIFREVYVFNSLPTTANDSIFLVKGAALDTQESVEGEQVYGAGFLHEDVSANATVIKAACETSTPVFQAGGKIVVGRMVSGTLHDYDIKTISSVTYAGTVAEITLNEGVNNSYSSEKIETDGVPTDYCIVASLVEYGDIKATITGLSNTSANGVINESLIGLDQLGVVDQTWTLTFNSSTTFTVMGDTLGDLGLTGNVSAETAPLNNDFSVDRTARYFTIPPTAFSGSFFSGNAITFTTNSATAPWWVKNVVEPNTAAFSNNNFAFKALASSD